MNLRTFSILGIATAVLVAAAIVGVSQETRGPTALSDGMVAFPKLQGRINDVAEITIINRDQKVVVAKSKNGWIMPEKFGYPVQVDKVRELVTGLEDLKLVESKTNKADRFARLEVDDPTGKEASGARVTLKAANGDVLVDTIVGKRKYDLSYAGIGGTYVRSATDNQVWLGRGELDPGKSESQWLQRKIVDIKKERVRRYEIKHADGEKIAASRSTVKDENFKAETLPEGQAMKSKSAADSIATTFAFLEFDDVKRAGDLKIQEKPLAQVSFTTFDGLIVDAAIFEVDGNNWVRFVARAGEVVAAPPEDVKQNEKAKASVPAKKDKVVPVPDEIKAANATLGAWLYKLPDFAIKNLLSRNTTFLPDKG